MYSNNYIKIYYTLFYIITLCFYNLKGFSQTIRNNNYYNVTLEAHRIIDSLQQKQKIPGIDIAISINGEIVWSEAFGFSDLENNVPVSPRKTVFRIGSVSKPITTAALGKLIDNGKINIDDNVKKYVSYFPKKKHPITIEQVAGHIAGIRHYKNNEYLSKENYTTVKSGVAIFKDDKLLFKPGTKFSYSSYGYNLLSAVIEGASGENFIDYVQREVFDALEMHTTYADKNEKIIFNRTSFYTLDSSGTIVHAPYVDNSYKWAGGGFISTTADLIKFGEAFINKGFLSEKTIKTLTTSLNINDGKETGYGIGWAVVNNKNLKRFSHDGTSVGGITKLIVYPNNKMVVVALSNSSKTKYGNVLERIVQLFLKAKPE